MTTSNLKRELIKDGYCVARNWIDPQLVEQLQTWSNVALSTISDTHRENNRSQGSLINLSDHPDFANIIGDNKLLSLFSELGFTNPVFSSGYIISKPPNSPPLFWHQDWWGWDDPVSYTAEPSQLFIMLYLTKTTAQNGCLRVIPGSHRNRHPLHNAEAAHGEALSKVTNPSDPLYQSLSDEVDVPVSPGDVVVGDARVLHGAHANQSDQERTLLTLWYHPDYNTLPAGMRARIMEIFYRRGVDTDPDSSTAQVMSDWPASSRTKVQHLFPTADQTAKPHAWNREPDPTKLLNS